MKKDMPVRTWYDRDPARVVRVEIVGVRSVKMLRVVFGVLLGLVLLAGCGSPAPAEPVVSDSNKTLVTVYKTPT
jgi:hypothetical protein